jgi:hypothetical protein
VTRRSHAAEVDPGLSNLPRLPIERVVAKVIEDCGGDPQAAVTELIAIVRALMADNKALREAASRATRLAAGAICFEALEKGYGSRRSR